MRTLDLRDLIELDTGALEDIDMMCPHCSQALYDGLTSVNEEECPECAGAGFVGEGEDGRECPLCEGLGSIDAEYECPLCGATDPEDGEYFEIMWNTMFNVPFLEMSWGEAREAAWQRGGLLFEHEGEYWLAMGSCGYDFTWVVAGILLEICGTIPTDYVTWITDSGHVFARDSERQKIALEVVNAIDRLMNGLAHTRSKFVDKHIVQKW